MAEEITIQLYPPNPVGVRIMTVPGQGVMPVPEPCHQYERVREVKLEDPDIKRIVFITRAGDEIQSVGIPYLVKRTIVPEGNA